MAKPELVDSNILPRSLNPLEITRPDRQLWTYYLLVSMLTGPGFFVAVLPLYFRYETLRYRFDEEGVSMSWGILFRKEVYLTYRRIQDIHLTRNLLQRWLGLSTIGIQTASGSATNEMSIEGIREAEQLRDFLYSKMRGAKYSHSPDSHSPDSHSPDSHSPDSQLSDGLSRGTTQPPATPADEFLTLLREIRDTMREHKSDSSQHP